MMLELPPPDSPDAEANPPGFIDAMRAALEAVLQKYAASPSDRGVMVNFLILAEQVGDDGAQWIRLIGDPDSPTWRQLGLLDYATTLLRSGIAEDYFSRDGDSPDAQ